jgi:aryl-alcohol dehydrogenase-like predicted oxidoreductase
VITLEDCIAMCGLTEEEILAIAEHEHIPEIAAAALAQYLLAQKHGPEKICRMLRDDIRAALARGDREHARDLFMALRHFVSAYPEARQRA